MAWHILCEPIRRNRSLCKCRPFEECFLTDFLQFILEKGYKIKCIPVFSDWVEVDSVNDLHLNETIYRIENIEKNL